MLTAGLLLGCRHRRTALVDFLGSSLVCVGKGNKPVQLDPGFECVALRVVECILGLAPFQGTAACFAAVTIRFAGCGFGFRRLELGFQLGVVEPDEQIAGFDAVVELNENLSDDGRCWCANAKCAPLGLDPSRCRRSPGRLCPRFLSPDTHDACAWGQNAKQKHRPANRDAEEAVKNLGRSKALPEHIFQTHGYVTHLHIAFSSGHFCRFRQRAALRLRLQPALLHRSPVP